VRVCLLGESRSIHMGQWAGWLASRGHEVILLTLGFDPIPGVQLVRLPFSERGSSAFPKKVAAVRRILREWNPDLVHAHQAVGFGLWGAVSGRHPFVVSAGRAMSSSGRENR